MKQFDEDYLQEELKKQSDRIMQQVKKRTDEVKHIFFKWLPYVFEQRTSVDMSKVMQYKRLKRILDDQIEIRTLELGAYNELIGNVKELTDEEVLQLVETDHELLDEDELLEIRMAGLPMVIKQRMPKVPTFDFADIPTQEISQSHIDEAHKRFLVADTQLKEIRDEFRNYSTQHGDHYRKYQYYTGELKNTQDRVMYIANEVSEYLKVYALIFRMRIPAFKKLLLQTLRDWNVRIGALLLLLLLLLLSQLLKFLSWNSLDEWNVAYAWTNKNNHTNQELYVSRPDQTTKLSAILQDSLQNNHGVYVVLGERGCGKTTLIEHVIAENRTHVVQINATASEELLALQLGQLFNNKPSFLQYLSRNASDTSFDGYLLRFCQTCTAIHENMNIVRKFLQVTGFWPQSKTPLLLIEDLDSALVLDHTGASQSPVLEKLVRVAHKIGIENHLCKVVVVATPSVLPHLTQVSKQLSDFQYIYLGDMTNTQAQDFLEKHSQSRGWHLEKHQTKNVVTTLGTSCGMLMNFVNVMDNHFKTTGLPINDDIINKALQLWVVQTHQQLTQTIPIQCQKTLREWAEETKSTKSSGKSEEWIKTKFKASVWDYQFVVYRSLLHQGIIKWNPVDKTVDFSSSLMLNTAKLLPK